MMRTLSAPPLLIAVAETVDPGPPSAWAQSFADDRPIDVSICIANWNCKEHLQACLTSLQDYPQGVRIETIVVDNSSTDGAPEMVAREFPEVVLVRNGSNTGFARASNQAAGRARGRYVFFLNNDTIVPPGTLGKLVAYAEQHPEIGMVGPLLRDGSGRMQISYRKMPTMWAMLHRAAILRWTGFFKMSYGLYRRQTFRPAEVERVEVLMGAAILMRRDVFERCGRWDEDFRFGVEDVELSARVGRRYGLVFHPGVEIIHHGRLSSRQNITFSAPNHLIGYVHYFRKTGYSRLSILAYKLLVTFDTPIQLLGRMVQSAIRRLRGKKIKAAKSRLALQGHWHFLSRAFLRFWRA
jgi:N-acetylglucosaminyl-diphospho-decaprenol L-rhamnosyltransferase